MIQLRSHLIGIDQGSLVLFSDFEDNGPMWAEQGPREVRKTVTFSQGYVSPPSVNVALAMWDMDQKTNARADIRPENITEISFDLVFRTWSDSRIARVRCSWQSIGELYDEEAWQLT